MGDNRGNMQDRLDGIAVFVESVAAGGFSRAAERLALSRSAVGKAIARLEARLGVRLFHRTTRALSLTEDGHIYYEHCVQVMEALRAAEALLDSGRKEVSGRLRVAVPVLFGRYCVAPILLELARAHPKLELDISFSDRPVDVIADGFDLAIRNGPLGKEVDGLRARRLPSQEKVLCAAPDYLAKRGVPDTIAALTGHDALLYWRADHAQPWVLPGDGGALTEFMPSSRFRLDDLEVVADAAVAGMGLAWLPLWLARERIGAGALVALLDGHAPAVVECHALWPAAQHVPPRLRLAIDALLMKLPQVDTPATQN